MKWIEEKKSAGKKSATKKSDKQPYEALVRSEIGKKKGPPVAAAAEEVPAAEAPAAEAPAVSTQVSEQVDGEAVKKRKTPKPSINPTGDEKHVAETLFALTNMVGSYREKETEVAKTMCAVTVGDVRPKITDVDGRQKNTCDDVASKNTETDKFSVSFNENNLDSILPSRTHVEPTKKLINSTYVSPVDSMENNSPENIEDSTNIGQDSVEPINYDSEYVDNDDDSQSTFGNFSD